MPLPKVRDVLIATAVVILFYDTGETAARFTEAFAAAARRGVDVRMVLDSIGRLPNGYARTLRRT